MAVGGGGGGGGSAAIKAGAAYVELFTNDTKLTAGLKAAQRRLASFDASMAKAGAVTLGTAGGLLTGTSLKALDTLGDTSRMSAAADAFGLTAEAASRLFGIMGSAGSDIRDATETLTGRRIPGDEAVKRGLAARPEFRNVEAKDVRASVDGKQIDFRLSLDVGGEPTT